MTEIIEPLTPDECTVLEIASKGESMMAIGRWEAATESLHRKRLLKKLDDVNYVITAAGIERMKQVDRDYDQALADMCNIVRQLPRKVR